MGLADHLPVYHPGGVDRRNVLAAGCVIAMGACVLRGADRYRCGLAIANRSDISEQFQHDCTQLCMRGRGTSGLEVYQMTCSAAIQDKLVSAAHMKLVLQAMLA